MSLNESATTRHYYVYPLVNCVNRQVSDLNYFDLFNNNFLIKSSKDWPRKDASICKKKFNYLFLQTIFY